MAATLVLGCTPNTSGLGGTVDSAGSSGGGSTSTNAVTDDSTTGNGTASAGGTANADDPTTDEDSTGTTAQSSSDSSGTGEPEPWPEGPFGPPVRVDALSTMTFNDDDPSLTADRLEIVFGSNQALTDDIFMATRTSVLDDWDAPVPIEEVNSDLIENTPEISGDGLILMFGSTRRGIPGDMDVYISYRDSRAEPWGIPQLVDGLSSNFEDAAPTVTPGLDEIYICSRRPRSVLGQDIFSASVIDNDGVLTFGEVMPVPELGSDFNDCTVSLSPDRRFIYFDTSRDDALLDLYVASRDDPGQPFGNLQPVTELNEPFAYDGDPWLSHDGHVIYFSSTRQGTQDIYYALR